MGDVYIQGPTPEFRVRVHLCLRMRIISSGLWVFPFMSIPPCLLRNTHIQSGSTIGGHARAATFTPTEAGVYIFSLMVNDGQVDSDSDDVRVTVIQPNRVPKPCILSNSDLLY